jgi:hypothetical protein
MNGATASKPIDPIAERQKWIAFAGKLLSLCLEIQRASNVQVTEKEFAEPKILALALLARTYLNLKGVIAVAKEGLVVETRTLARSCFENLFLVPNLIEKGDEFVTAMYDHDRRSVRSQGEFLLEDLDYLDPFGVEMANQLRARLREIKARRPNARLLNVKEVASDTVMRPAYLFYSQLSADAAHPTIRALKRHLVQTVENGERFLGLDIQPVERGAEVTDSVNIACCKPLGANLVPQTGGAARRRTAACLSDDPHLHHVRRLRGDSPLRCRSAPLAMSRRRPPRAAISSGSSAAGSTSWRCCDSPARA